MLNYLQYLNVPTKVTIALVTIFLILQIIGEILEFKGKAVPEIVKVRKYFARKKHEREVLHQLPNTLGEIRNLVNEFEKHYSKDNITKRDKWIENVNHKLEQNDGCIKELDRKLDENNKNTLSLLIDNKRNTIINFASHVIDENNPVTREQFNRVFKIYEEYEDIIEKNKLTNGEIDIAIHIIQESYEKHMKAHSFIEDVRGY
jgi:transcriptional regulator of heat shock response